MRLSGRYFSFLMGFSSLLLLMLFQNCSGDSSKVRFSSANSAQSGGNGDYYGGKPHVGTYYRFLTGAICDSNEGLLGQINVTKTDILISQTQAESCGKTEFALQADELSFSYYNPRFIGFEEGVYVRYENFTGTPDSVRAEALCRRPGSTSRAGFDVLIETNGTSGEIVSTFFAGVLNWNGETLASRSTPIQVQRKISGGRVDYRASDFYLEIGGSSDASSAVLSARLQARDALGRAIDERLECRMAGALDTADVAAPVLAQQVPGRVEVENYDAGGPDLGYFDLTPGDQGGASERGDDVDTRVVVSGIGVTNMEAGEWLKYTLEVSEDGVYEITMGVDRTMSAGTPITYRFELDGIDVTGLVNVPLTNHTPGTHPPHTVPAFRMSQGRRTLRVRVEGGTSAVNHMDFVRTGP